MPRNGITLMTLIITIVIMLIIAGVTIGITMNGDGLADKAQEQVNKTNNRIAKDQEATQGIIDEIKDELKVDVSGVVLDTTNVTLKIGDTKTITATVVPQNSPNKAITWTSSDSSVVTVNNGLITAIKTGTAIITVTTQEGNESASCSVTVIEGKVSVETVEITPTEITIPRRSTSILTATITPENATNKNATWSSSDSQVATVDSNGIVTAVNGGIAVITVTTQDGGKTASCTVKVNPFDTTKVPDVVIESSTIAGVNKQRIAPIPVGYTKSGITSKINADSPEDTIAGGLVVYQIPSGATVDWANNQITLSGETTAINLQENVNQYVWIPVDDINDMVMCKKNGTTGTDGSTCELVYDVASNEITCQTHNYSTATELTDSNIDTVGLAGRLYATDATDPDGDKIYQTSMDFTTTSQTFSANSGYREPDLAPGDDNSNYQLVLKESTTQALGSANALKHQLNDKFIAMAKSVAKYGGFYISRYEPSYENSKVISKKNQKVLTSAASATNTVNYLAGDKWYGLYNKTLNSVEKDESVNSHMIWGCQYDQVIKFLGEKAQIGHLYQTKIQQKTGYAEDQDILNNIYDLEGNNDEWTAQSRNTSGRVGRGGYCNVADNSSSFHPASYRRGNLPTTTYDVYTTRPTLYVK